MIRPSNRKSSRSKSVTTRRESEAGSFLLFETGIPAVANHHAIDARSNLPKNGQLVRLQLLARAIDLREIVVRIETRRGVTGEMFAAAGDAFCAQGIIESAGAA